MEEEDDDRAQRPYRPDRPNKNKRVRRAAAASSASNGPWAELYACSCCHRKQFFKSELLNIQPNQRSWQGSMPMVCYDCCQAVEVQNPEPAPVSALRGVWAVPDSSDPVIENNKEPTWCTAWAPGASTARVITFPWPVFKQDRWFTAPMFHGVDEHERKDKFKKDVILM
jgi:hypothetical protein